MESQGSRKTKGTGTYVGQSIVPKSASSKKNKARRNAGAAKHLSEESKEKVSVKTLGRRNITVREQISRLSLSLTTGKRVSEEIINQSETVRMQKKTSVILGLVEDLSCKLNGQLKSVVFFCNETGYAINDQEMAGRKEKSPSIGSKDSPPDSSLRIQNQKDLSFKTLENDYARLKSFTVQLSELAKEQYCITVHNKASHKALSTAEDMRRVGNRKMQMGGKNAEKAKLEMALYGFEDTEIKEAKQGTLKDSMEETIWQLCSTSEKLLPYLLAKFAASQSLTHEIICEYAKHNRERISQSYVVYIQLHSELLACLYDTWVTYQKGNLPITRDYGILIDECGRMLAFFAFNIVKNICTSDEVIRNKLLLTKYKQYICLWLDTVDETPEDSKLFEQQLLGTVSILCLIEEYDKCDTYIQRITHSLHQMKSCVQHITLLLELIRHLAVFHEKSSPEKLQSLKNAREFNKVLSTVRSITTLDTITKNISNQNVVDGWQEVLSDTQILYESKINKISEIEENAMEIGVGLIEDEEREQINTIINRVTGRSKRSGHQTHQNVDLIKSSPTDTDDKQYIAEHRVDDSLARAIKFYIAHRKKLPSIMLFQHIATELSQLPDNADLQSRAESLYAICDMTLDWVDVNVDDCMNQKSCVEMHREAHERDCLVSGKENTRKLKSATILFAKTEDGLPHVLTEADNALDRFHDCCQKNPELPNEMMVQIEYLNAKRDALVEKLTAFTDECKIALMTYKDRKSVLQRLGCLKGTTYNEAERELYDYLQNMGSQSENIKALANGIRSKQLFVRLLKPKELQPHEVSGKAALSVKEACQNQKSDREQMAVVVADSESSEKAMIPAVIWEQLQPDQRRHFQRDCQVETLSVWAKPIVDSHPIVNMAGVLRCNIVVKSSDGTPFLVDPISGLQKKNPEAIPKNVFKITIPAHSSLDTLPLASKRESKHLERSLKTILRVDDSDLTGASLKEKIIAIFLSCIDQINKQHPGGKKVVYHGSFSRRLQGFDEDFNDVDVLCPRDAFDEISKLFKNKISKDYSLAGVIFQEFKKRGTKELGLPETQIIQLKTRAEDRPVLTIDFNIVQTSMLPEQHILTTVAASFLSDAQPDVPCLTPIGECKRMQNVMRLFCDQLLVKEKDFEPDFPIWRTVVFDKRVEDKSDMIARRGAIIIRALMLIANAEKHETRCMSNPEKVFIKSEESPDDLDEFRKHIAELKLKTARCSYRHEALFSIKLWLDSSKSYQHTIRPHIAFLQTLLISLSRNAS